MVTLGSTTTITSPPRPPLPPSGPPSGLNFSRCTEAQPLPPSPALAWMTTRSTNVVTVVRGVTEGRPWLRSGFGNDTDDATTAGSAELHAARAEREEGVIASATDVRARVEVRAALADDDLTGIDDAGRRSASRRGAARWSRDRFGCSMHPSYEPWSYFPALMRGDLHTGELLTVTHPASVSGLVLVAEDAILGPRSWSMTSAVDRDTSEGSVAS